MRQTVKRQHNTWLRDQVEEGHQQLECGNVFPPQREQIRSLYQFLVFNLTSELQVISPTLR